MNLRIQSFSPTKSITFKRIFRPGVLILIRTEVLKRFSFDILNILEGRGSEFQNIPGIDKDEQLIWY